MQRMGIQGSGLLHATSLLLHSGCHHWLMSKSLPGQLAGPVRALIAIMWWWQTEDCSFLIRIWFWRKQLCLWCYTYIIYIYIVNIIICNSGDFEKTFLLAQLRSYNKDVRDPYHVDQWSKSKHASVHLWAAYLNLLSLTACSNDRYKAFLCCVAERRCQSKSTLASCSVQGFFATHW